MRPSMTPSYSTSDSKRNLAYLLQSSSCHDRPDSLLFKMKLVGIFILLLSLYLVALKGSGNKDGAAGHRESKIDLLWEDESLDGSRWTVETFSDSRSVPPLPASDSDDKYLRVKLDSSVFGVAILRSSVFTARPGDSFSFSYFVSSKPGRPLTNLQLSFSTLDKKEKLLVDIRSIIPEKIEEWQTVSGIIPVEIPTELTLVFYGFCGDSGRDVVVIDEINVDSNGLPSSSEATVPSYSTETTPETTSTALTCPSETLLATSSVCTSSGSAKSTERPSSPALMISTSTRPPTTTRSKSKCPNREDYNPCTCDASTLSETKITCDRIGFDEVMDVFNRTIPVDIDVLYLKIIEDTIPANLTAKSRIGALWIVCTDINQFLLIDKDAFSSCAEYMKHLYLLTCDLSQLDFSFLNGFIKLEALHITTNCVGFFISWSTLPSSLSKLKELEIADIEEDEEISDLFPQFPKLTNLHIDSCDGLRESSYDSFLETIAASASLSLDILMITGSSLTRLPPQINSFTRLSTLQLGGNKQLSVLGPYVFNSSLVQVFYFDNCNLEFIDPDAFTGVNQREIDLINLDGNQLTKLEHDSFWPILEKLLISTVVAGILSVKNNPFDCTTDPCHLAWIIRDHRELLDVRLLNAACSNGTKFSDLDPAFFDQCP